MSRRSQPSARRSPSSRRWLKRQRRDRFAKAARQEGRVSRAHYKLAQIDRRFQLLKADLWVLELGAAPGGWTSYLAERVRGGRVIAVDPLPIASGGAPVQAIAGRFGEAKVERRLWDIFAQAPKTPPLDLVLSDMAPNISGVRAADLAASLALADLAAEAAGKWLAPGGALVVKLMQGEGFDAWLCAAKRNFRQVNVVKPPASRPESREAYAIARGHRVDL